MVAGAFHFFNDAQSTQNALQYLAPSPTSIVNPEPLFPPQSIPNTFTRSKSNYLHS